MKHEDLPQRWKNKLRIWLLSRGENHRERLGAQDFESDKIAKLEFEDDSHAEFHYPLVIQAQELNEVAIFTEHCGHHIFNLDGIHIVIQSKEQ